MDGEFSGADVAVVGAGAIGCAVAWRLAREGLSVVLVERVYPGAETSSAAAGILAAQIEAEEDGAFFRFLWRSEQMYADFAGELRSASGMEIGYRACGALKVALDEADLAPLAVPFAWQRAEGLPVERLNGPAIRELEPSLSPEIRGGLLFPSAAQVDAQRLTPALWTACRRAGCRLARGEARRILARSGKVTGVEVAGRALAASAVVVASGSWSALVPGAGLPTGSVRPVRGQMIRFEGLPPVRRVVFGAGGYLVPRLDGHLLAGATMEEVGFDKSTTAEGVTRLGALARRLCPPLAGMPVSSSWAGLRPACPDGLPALGPLPAADGIFLAAGHLRNGILLTPATAEVIAAMVLGRPYELPPQMRAGRLVG